MALVGIPPLPKLRYANPDGIKSMPFPLPVYVIGPLKVLPSSLLFNFPPLKLVNPCSQPSTTMFIGLNQVAAFNF